MGVSYQLQTAAKMYSKDQHALTLNAAILISFVVDGFMTSFSTI